MSRRRQTGVALLAAVLVVALAAVLVAGLLDRGEAARARSRNSLRAEQTWQLQLGVELWAQRVLREDFAASGEFDAGTEGWAMPLPPLEVPGGRLSGRLLDGSGCFNVNNLALDDSEQARELARFQRLLRALKLDPRLAMAVLDFVDRDQTPSPNGAEDGVYLAADPPRRAANRPLLHPSELRLVVGLDDEVYRRLRPHVCTWPAPTAINLNFASVPLWMSLDDDITESIARGMWRDGRAEFRSADEAADELGRLLGRPLPLFRVGVESRWFVLQSELLVDGLPFVYAGVIERDRHQTRTVARLRGRW